MVEGPSGGGCTSAHGAGGQHDPGTPHAPTTESPMSALYRFESPLDADERGRRASNRVGGWAAHILIGWPEGVDRHPRLFDLVQRGVSRPCGLNMDYDGLWLTCALEGEDSTSAGEDAAMLATELLATVGLGRAALRDCAVVPIQRDREPGAQASAAHRRPLCAVPDLDEGLPSR